MLGSVASVLPPASVPCWPNQYCRCRYSESALAVLLAEAPLRRGTWRHRGFAGLSGGPATPTCARDWLPSQAEGALPNLPHSFAGRRRSGLRAAVLSLQICPELL